MVSFTENERKRIRYLTRRGLLELDILLGRFMDKEFQTMSDAELAIFVELLDLPDPDFLALVNQQQICEDERFVSLLEKIRRS